jgi:uncharacterized protein
MIKNPFSKTVIGDEDPLCNQKDLLASLLMEAFSGNNNVLLAPRRAGKTSLAMRLARDYQAQGGLAVIADLNSVPSVDAAADRIASAIYAALSTSEKIFKKLTGFVSAYVPVITMNPDNSFSVSAAPSGLEKTGIGRLVSVVSSLDKISSNSQVPLLVVLDEFQDLALLNDATQIEAALRTTIQHHKAAYLFIGSRRKLLRDMFESPKRAFYRGATTRELPLITASEFSTHLVALAELAGVVWPASIADAIINVAESHTYSVTAIAHALFEETAPKTPTEYDLNKAIATATARETSLFLSIYASLNPSSRMLLEALAIDATKHPMANAYIAKHRLTTSATVKKALVALIAGDHIETDPDGLIVLTDPLFKRWLSTKWNKREMITGLSLTS